jgi:hypothetical protein
MSLLERLDVRFGSEGDINHSPVPGERSALASPSTQRLFPSRREKSGGEVAVDGKNGKLIAPAAYTEKLAFSKQIASLSLTHLPC